MKHKTPIKIDFAIACDKSGNPTIETNYWSSTLNSNQTYLFVQVGTALNVLVPSKCLNEFVSRNMLEHLRQFDSETHTLIYVRHGCFETVQGIYICPTGHMSSAIATLGFWGIESGAVIFLGSKIRGSVESGSDEILRN